MPLSSAEAYLIELINRARLDPAAEARREGIALNQGLAAGTITTAPKQPLAYNETLGRAAAGHSRWMLDKDIFGHAGAGGTNAKDRMINAGYAFKSPWAWGENLSLLQSRDAGAAIPAQHSSLYASPSHRANMFGARYREIGVGQEMGDMTYRGKTFRASMVTENFTTTGTANFVTGLAYRDRNGNDFYGIGEGTAGIRFSIGAKVMATQAAGDYALSSAAKSVDVQIKGAGVNGSVRVDLSAGNVKLDLVDGTDVFASGNVRLLSGLTHLKLLGIGNYSATGTKAGDQIDGNEGNNEIRGGAGDDTLRGQGGHDRLLGEDGNDRLEGGAGNDHLHGGNGADRLYGGLGNDVLEGGPGHDRLEGAAGNDRLSGGAGNDIMLGGAGNDRLDSGAGNDRMLGEAGADIFVFAPGHGRDIIVDFDPRAGDRLALDDALWGGRLTAAQAIQKYDAIDHGDLVLDFGHGQTLVFEDFTDVAALIRAVDLF